MLDQRAPRGIQVHQMSANREALEDEAVQRIAVMHLRTAAQLASSAAR